MCSRKAQGGNGCVPHITKGVAHNDHKSLLRGLRAEHSFEREMIKQGFIKILFSFNELRLSATNKFRASSPMVVFRVGDGGGGGGSGHCL